LDSFFFCSPSSSSCVAKILQKSLPKLLITLPESVGDSIEQYKQSFEGLHASTLKPPDFPLSLGTSCVLPSNYRPKSYPLLSPSDSITTNSILLLADHFWGKVNETEASPSFPFKITLHVSKLKKIWLNQI
jgi:hypothetical protein